MNAGLRAGVHRIGCRVQSPSSGSGMMDDDRSGDGEMGDELAPPVAVPYRPWTAGRVPHPETGRPRPPPTTSPPPSPFATVPERMEARPFPRIAPRTGSRTRPPFVVAIGIVLAAAAWLPWVKSPLARTLDLSGSGIRATAHAWEVPAVSLWSYHAGRPGDLDLGWLLLVPAVAMMGLVFVDHPGARRAVRWLVALEGVVVVLFMVQMIRFAHDLPTVPGRELGFADFVGIGGYATLLASLAFLVVPRD